MMYDLILTGKFKKSLKLAKKRGLNISLLEEVVNILQSGEELDKKYRDHELKGKYKNFRECHIPVSYTHLICVKQNDVI